MIVRFGGGNSGIAEYLEQGNKQGRVFSRDELDQRVILEGDLELTDKIINSITNKGQERYLHITLSFSEDVIENETLKNIVQDYRELLMSSYADDEFNFYAEAHLPKIKRIKDERTNEMIVRKPHIHIVIPEINLLTFRKLTPVGLIAKYERYLDSMQEYINNKYNLKSPKDYVRNPAMHRANVLSRIKGDFFGQKQQEIKNQLIDEIERGEINSIDDFQKRLETIGEVKLRNKGKENQYYAVKIGNDSKFTNLKHPIFNEGYIKNKVLPNNKPTQEQIDKYLKDWKEIVSKEIKHVNFATQSFRQLYAASDPEAKQQLLSERILNYERKYRYRDLSKNRWANNYKSNLKHVERRRQNRAASRKTVSMSGVSYSDLVCRKVKRSGNVKSILSEDEYVNIRNGKPSNFKAVRRYGRSRKRVNGRRINKQSFYKMNKGLPASNLFINDIERREYKTEFEKYQDLSAQIKNKFIYSNMLESIRSGVQSEQDKKIELEKFKHIRRNIDPIGFLYHVANVYGVNPNQHKVTYAKDGSPRFNVDNRNLNASDFLTKYLNLEWKEAKAILVNIYDNQKNNKQNKSNNITKNIGKNIEQFAIEAKKFQREFALIIHNLNVDNRNLYKQEKKRIYVRFTNIKIRNQELAIASFRAMQRLERIKYYQSIAVNTLKNEKFTFIQSGYSNVEERKMAFKDTLNIALGNEFGRVSPANESVNFSENFKQQQVILQRQLQEQRRQIEQNNSNNKPSISFNSKALEEVMRLNNIGIAKKKNGDIEYKRLEDGKTICTDVGNQMLISKEMQNSQNIKTFLELAIDKYGNELKISGSKEFKKQVVEIAAANNLPIILKPAALQDELIEKRKELQLESRIESIDSITNDAGIPLRQDQHQSTVEAKDQVKDQYQATDSITNDAGIPLRQDQHQVAVEAKDQVKDQHQVAVEAKDQVKDQHQVAVEAKDQVLQATIEKATKLARDFIDNPTESTREYLIHLRRNPEFNKAYEHAESQYWSEKSQNKTYSVEFKFNRKESAYDVTINNQPAKDVIKNDLNALNVLKNHPDIIKHKVSLEELKAGVINRVESMKAGNRPQNMNLNSAGQKIIEKKETKIKR